MGMADGTLICGKQLMHRCRPPSPSPTVRRAHMSESTYRRFVRDRQNRVGRASPAQGAGPENVSRRAAIGLPPLLKFGGVRRTRSRTGPPADKYDLLVTKESNHP